MSKPLIKTVISIAFVFLISVGFTYVYPIISYAVLKNALTPHGFKDISYQEHVIGWDYVQFKNVSLDKDSINTIEELTFIFKPIDLLQNKIDKIVIKRAEIIASLSPDSNDLVLDGWLSSHGTAGFLNLKANELSFLNSDFTLLTQEYGGITLSLNALASLQNPDENLYEFQSDFTTQQQSFSLYGKARGSFSDRFISLESSFDRGKIEIPSYKIILTRLHGWGRLSYDTVSLDILSEIQAGGLRLASLPWENASMTYQKAQGQSALTLSAQSAGVKGLELALSAEDDKNSITIHAPKESIWNTFIQANNLTKQELDQIVDFLSQLNTKIEFQ